MARARSFTLLAALGACPLCVACDAPPDPRADEVIGSIAAADEPFIRNRPALSDGKYHLMATDAFSYLRGSLAVTQDDWSADRSGLAESAFSISSPMVYGIGDAHVENFGTLRASDGTLALEPNDFDAADAVPYLWDLRRLCTSLAYAATISNPDNATAQSAAFSARSAIARACAQGYRDAIFSLANGAAPTRITDGGQSAVLVDLFQRATTDGNAREEFTELTDFDGTTRTLKRGVLDPTDPDNVFVDLPDFARAALPDMFASYVSTLSTSVPLENFTVLDAVRELGAGVSSWPKIRAIVLVRGPSDDPSDDVILEVKELTNSGRFPGAPPGISFDDNGARVRGCQMHEWARPDADEYWGVSSWLGFEVQVRAETEAAKGIKTDKLTGDLGTVEALTDLATSLGGLLARMHSSDRGPLLLIATALQRDPEGFCDEQASVSAAYSDRIYADSTVFRNGVKSLGYSLGVNVMASDAPPANLAALYGTPPAEPPAEELTP